MKMHKYSGSDHGLAYVYFYNPVATRLVECLPDWIAPNLITFVGFLFTLVIFFPMFFVYGFNLVGPLPSWLVFVQALCFFAYRMLDEMDGKQARRTGNSSPLGLLFDHGVDCLSTVLQALIALRIGQIGNNIFSILFMTIGLCTFHFVTLEEYYVGTLYLPVGNPVSDGSILMVGWFIFSGVMGTDFWLNEGPSAEWLGIEGLKYFTYGQTLFMVFLFFITLSMLAVFFKIIKSRWHPWETQTEFVDFRHLAVQVLGIAAFTATWWWYGSVGRDRIFFQNLQVTPELSAQQMMKPEAHALYFFLHLLLYGLLVAHATMWLMLCHVSKQKYQPFVKLVVFAMIAFSVKAASAQMETGETFSMRDTLVAILVIVVFFQWVFIFTAIAEITTTLDISVFRTKQTMARIAEERARAEGVTNQVSANNSRSVHRIL